MTQLSHSFEIRTSGPQPAVRYEMPQPGLEYYWLTADGGKPFPDELSISFTVPCSGVQFQWDPKCNLGKAFNSDWFEQRHNSGGLTGAPVRCLIGLGDENRFTAALSDTRRTVCLQAAAVEETACYQFEATFKPQCVPDDYSLCVRVDSRPLPYYTVLAETARWWESVDAAPAPVPQAARRPMYSTWYSFHQQLHANPLLEQCRRAKALGCESILLDDGWQTDDSRRGYTYCGDWRPAPSKLGDMAAFTREVHKLGMNVIVWYSVPFVGVKSQAFSKFHDMLVDPRSERGWHVLDPRFPAVREHLISLYEQALDEWDLDGFKLDFVDEFVVTPFSGEAVDPRRDLDDLGVAADLLLRNCAERLRAKKPGILFEFRQTYNGPRMRACGNIFRAVDCPFDALENRVRVTDLRLLGGNTAVHSDMLMWNPEESAESAALQLINVLFSVPQISMRLDLLPERQAQMLDYYCGLWRRYRRPLTEGSFLPAEPQHRYPIIRGVCGDEAACAVFGGAPAPLEEGCRAQLFVNGSYRPFLFLESVREQALKACVRDCTGRVLSDGTVAFQAGVTRLAVPVSGTAELFA